MAFSDAQARQLKAKLDGQHVKARKENGATLHYIEGWYAIAEANRIFGYDAWDRRTVATRCVWTEARSSHFLAAYTARVRISVRAGDIVIVREGCGTGEAKAATPGHAHEIALKTAETDATKRALATFGNPFGLALYDSEQTGVRQRNTDKTATEVVGDHWMVRSLARTTLGTFGRPEDFCTALCKAMSAASTMDDLFGVWEQNVATVRALNYALKQTGNVKPDLAKDLVNHLKSCATALVKPSTESAEARSKGEPSSEGPPVFQNGIDKSALSIGETKRHRSKEHLKFVASQSCLICGRAPSHAHHIRYAQPKGLALKVSDEFTVPLCATHHSENHMTGNELQWWQDRNIEPLSVARKLWQEFRELNRIRGPAG
jgi:Rad52/22 family double-strand break repair protein